MQIASSDNIKNKCKINRYLLNLYYSLVTYLRGIEVLGALGSTRAKKNMRKQKKSYLVIIRTSLHPCMHLLCSPELFQKRKSRMYATVYIR